MKKIANILHHLLIPKKENNYRAKALHHDFLTGYLVVALLLTFFMKTTPLGNVLGYATDITIEKLYQMTNEQREKEGLSKLTYNDQLQKAAEAKAKDMFEKNYWAHYSPDGSTTPWTFILGAGYQYEYAGENLAKNFMFSQGVVDAWMASPSHRENIMRSEYSDVGFAIVNGVLNGEETTLVVQMFGTPIAGAGKQPEKAQAPSPIPQPEVKQAKTYESGEPVILTKKDTSYFPTFFNLNILFFVFFAAALLLDLYFAARLNMIRITGKNIIHFLFITFIIVGTWILRNGTIF